MSSAGIRKCAVCGLVKAPEELKQCSRCKHPNYLLCSKACQQADWKRHKKEDCVPVAQQNPLENLTKSEGNKKVASVIFQRCMEPGDKLCLFYSRNLHDEGLPELYAFDVPISLKEKIVYLLSMVVEECRIPGKVFHGYKVKVDNYWLMTLDVQKESHRQKFAPYMLPWTDPSVRIRLVKPLWDNWETIPAPDIRQEEILGRWRQYRIDNPPMSAQLERALLSSERTWELYLTPKQIKYVDENWDYMLRMGLTELCSPPMDKAAAFLNDVAENLLLAGQRYPHGIKVAQGNYTWDI